MKKKKIVLVELFAGSGRISELARLRGIKTLTLDFNKKLAPDWTIDVNKLAAQEFLNKLECSLVWSKADIRIFWASVPCQSFTKLMIGENWNHVLLKKNIIRYTPKTKKATMGLELLNKAIELKNICKPTFYFFENPVGVMRHLSQIRTFAIRKTVSYLDYGFDYLKPTDIFTNNWDFKPLEIRWNKMKKGKIKISNLKNNYERSLIPDDLINLILDSCL